LSVALVNAGTGVVAVYVLLCAIGWILFLVFIIRPVFIAYCRRTGSFENGPTSSVIIVVILLILLSSFVTDIIGVHPIFGRVIGRCFRRYLTSCTADSWPGSSCRTTKALQPR
jgi:Kef-type K+ transport system membrane component KefB